MFDISNELSTTRVIRNGYSFFCFKLKYTRCLRVFTTVFVLSKQSHFISDVREVLGHIDELNLDSSQIKLQVSY